MYAKEMNRRIAKLEKRIKKLEGWILDLYETIGEKESSIQESETRLTQLRRDYTDRIYRQAYGIEYGAPVVTPSSSVVFVNSSE